MDKLAVANVGIVFEPVDHGTQRAAEGYVTRRRFLSGLCTSGACARGDCGCGTEGMEAACRSRGSGVLEGTGDSGSGSIPNCSSLMYGDGALVNDAIRPAGSSGGGYVGVVVILGGNGQSLVLFFDQNAGGRLIKALNPHGLDRSDEPDAVAVVGIVHHGWWSSLKSVHVVRSIFFSIAVCYRAFKGR